MDDERRARIATIAARAAVEERRRAAERARAQKLIDGFVEEMLRRGEPPVPLRARVVGRRETYRTDRTGWYVRPRRALAVGVDGSFVILDAPPSLRSRLFGVEVPSSDPPLVVGRGARDGESIDLADLLAQHLNAG